MRLADCHACQIGDHDNHQRSVQSVPKGMLGGVVCSCEGECTQDAEERKRRFLERILGPASTGKESDG